MEQRKCMQCGNEYEAKNKTGQEQKFCSRSCRNKHHNQRRQENLFTKFKNEYIHEPTMSGNVHGFQETNIESNRISHSGLSFEKTIELIQSNAMLTSENKRLTEKVETMQIEINQLESEIEELEEKIGHEENSGMGATMGNLAKEYAPLFATWIMSKNQSNSNAKAKTA